MGFNHCVFLLSYVTLVDEVVEFAASVLCSTDIFFHDPGHWSYKQKKPNRARYVLGRSPLLKMTRLVASELISHIISVCIVALLRPGRFEVQIEIPPPRSVEQRVSILKVHTKHMFNAGRLQVNDPPSGTAAAHHLEVS